MSSYAVHYGSNGLLLALFFNDFFVDYVDSCSFFDFDKLYEWALDYDVPVPSLEQQNQMCSGCYYGLAFCHEVDL